MAVDATRAAPFTMSDASFDDIVAGFYRAAGGACSWVDALVPFQRAMQAIVVHLHGVDTLQGRIAFSHAASDLPMEAELDYLRTYHRIDPRTNLVLGREPGVWFNCWEVFDDAFVASDRFYQEFLIPYGGRYVSGVKLMQDKSMCAILGVHRGIASPKLDPHEISTCQRLAGHLGRALKLYLSAAQRHQASRLGLEVLNRLRAPVVLIDDQRLIRQANPAARVLLSSSDAVFDSNGYLYCRRPTDDAGLLQSLRMLLWDDEPVPTNASGKTLFVRARTSLADGGVGLYIDALRPDETMHVFGDRPLAMVMIHDPRSHLRLDPLVVATAFELTPAEARVAVAVAEGASADQIAKRHRTSIHTVRSQLQTILQKTGATRQAEMVGMLAGLPMAALVSGR